MNHTQSPATGDQAIERAIVSAGANVAPRVTPADIEAAIVSEHYFTAEDGRAGAIQSAHYVGRKCPTADDADIDAAVRAAGSGIFFNTGQVCSAGSRILVHESIHDEVAEKLAARAKGMRLGNPQEAGTSMGPVVSEVQMNRILNYIEIGRAEGAQVVTGGARHGDQGYFIEPTVFANVKHEMRISQEEIFGPVAAVVPFKDDDDALRLANGTVYSLAAGVWTADMTRAHRFTRKLKAGTVWVNTYGPTDIRLPWGGVRDSGFGREHGEEAIDNFTEPKVVWINTGPA